MLLVENLSHRYGRRSALSDVSFSAERGILGLVGENGAGKTTLLRLCGGLLGIQRGNIAVGETALTARSSSRYLKKVAYVPQAAALPQRFTAMEFVTYLGWMRGLSSTRATTRARCCLDLVGLASRAQEPLGSLSGGMQRRVWLAQALVTEPEVLLLDEPSTGLDPKQRAHMVQALQPLGEQCVVILSSHIIEDVVELASDLVVLNAGRVAYSGETPCGFNADAFLKLISGEQRRGDV